MPNVWAHFIFRQLVVDKLGEGAILKSDGHKRMFNFGCQGPDFLFYHRFLPWQKSTALNQLASDMHNSHCGHVLVSLIDSTKSLNPAINDLSSLYTLGFVLHHILDRNVHPYVFSKSGFRKWDHQRYEIMMDTEIVRKLWGLETWKTPVWKYIDTRLPGPIVDAFEAIVRKYYAHLEPQISRSSWNEATRDFTSAQRLFHDPTGIRRKLTFGRLDPFVYRRTVPYDVLNVEEQPWIDPVDASKYHHDSVWTLWDKALKDALAVMPLIIQWLREGSETKAASLREEAIASIGNRSYETGLDCDSGASIRYADTIWLDQPGITEAPAHTN